MTADDGVGEEATNSVVAVLDITAAMTGRWSFGGRRAEWNLMKVCVFISRVSCSLLIALEGANEPSGAWCSGKAWRL